MAHQLREQAQEHIDEPDFDYEFRLGHMIGRAALTGSEYAAYPAALRLAARARRWVAILAGSISLCMTVAACSSDYTRERPPDAAPPPPPPTRRYPQLASRCR